MLSRKYLLRCALIAAFAVSANFALAQTATQPASDLTYQLGGVLYMQKAAEYRALCYQAFNAARVQLDFDLDKKNVKKLPKAERKRPRAIVVDIDETVLDNSPAQALGIKMNTPYNPKDWYAWSNMRKAKAVPGSVEFLNYAISKGVKIFFVSNRDDKNEKQATIDNLKSVGFNDISTENVLLRTAESGKDARRAVASANHRIVLLVGDNLDDFTSAFERKSVADRFAEADRLKDAWGKRFIVLPNAMYGTWENAIYEYQRLTEAEKAARRAAALELP
jgi:5'-nucleotidase (lipoprotein e(P4) family)